jgi:hypothetical protein
VIQAAGADVVRPAVAADDPYASPDEMVNDAAQVGDDRFVQAVKAPLQLGEPFALRPQLLLV